MVRFGYLHGVVLRRKTVEEECCRVVNPPPSFRTSKGEVKRGTKRASA